ncbi:hypothetical protein Cyast_2092 [Cyanobacterium stanieri PCC 7202]|uniref:Uncharacterized protein n=1 Tax=Cyanobacterium stanieri (strain ATCC 29140 / PCC 7202) TaxID=292563 RepID=K9YNL3_CYASC|nr:hypothetical protein Cyast_2092 [Cyanobacterium stanieri PCC 7202]
MKKWGHEEELTMNNEQTMTCHLQPAACMDVACYVPYHTDNHYPEMKLTLRFTELLTCSKSKNNMLGCCPK